jgi:hypothetical protein
MGDEMNRMHREDLKAILMASTALSIGTITGSDIQRGSEIADAILAELSRTAAPEPPASAKTGNGTSYYLVSQDGLVQCIVPERIYWEVQNETERRKEVEADNADLRAKLDREIKAHYVSIQDCFDATTRAEQAEDSLAQAQSMNEALESERDNLAGVLDGLKNVQALIGWDLYSLESYNYRLRSWCDKLSERAKGLEARQSSYNDALTRAGYLDSEDIGVVLTALVEDFHESTAGWQGMQARLAEIDAERRDMK